MIVFILFSVSYSNCFDNLLIKKRIWELFFSKKITFSFFCKIYKIFSNKTKSSLNNGSRILKIEISKNFISSNDFLYSLIDLVADSYIWNVVESIFGNNSVKSLQL